MQDAKSHSEHFSRFQKMPDIGAAVSAADRAAAAFLDRPRIQLVCLVQQIQLAVIGINMAVAAVPAGIDAVEEIDASFYTFQNVRRRSDSHQIGRFGQRQMRYDLIQDVIHLLMAFPDSQAAHRIAGQIQLGDLLRMADPDVFVGSALRST